MLYFDYNSTHPPFIDLMQGAIQAYQSNWANPSGISHPSQRNQARIEQARSSILHHLHTMHEPDRSGTGISSPDAGNVRNTQAGQRDLLFLSTGTEAIYHMVAAFADRACRRVLVSPYEHECMYAACIHHRLEMDMLDGDATGRVNPDDVKNRLNAGPYAFVAVTAACNETGVIQPLTEIRSAMDAAGADIPLLSDSIQVAGKSTLDLSPADAIAINGHKVGAGPGASGLALNKRFGYHPIFRGGMQERERRAGTENLPAILSLEAALQRQHGHVTAGPSDASKHHEAIEAMLKDRCGAIIAGEGSPRTPTTYAVFPEMQNMDFLLMGLDREGILCSTGSSCKSRARQPSSTLQRMGFSVEASLRALRFSSGFFTQSEEVDRLCQIFPALYDRCR